MDISYFDLFDDISQQLSQDPNLRLELSFSDYQSFQCSQCAQCCRKPERTPVSQAYIEQWRETFQQADPDRFDQPFVAYPRPTAEEAANLSRHKDQDSCVFLDPDNLCWIQKNHGHTALPEECQMFPREQTQMGEHLLNRSLRAICRTVPKLWQTPPRLQWVLNPVPHPAVENEWAHQHVHLLCLGITLDELSRFTPVQALRHLNQIWTSLLQNGQGLSGPLIKTFYERWPHLQVTAMPFTPQLEPQQFQDLLAWLKPRIAGSDLQRVFAEADGFASPDTLPKPSTTQKAQVQTYLSHYLMQQSLLARESLHDGLNLLQQHLMMVEHCLFLQLLILCQLSGGAELTSDVLAHVTNQWGFFLEQRRRTLQNREVGQMVWQSCLQNSRWFLSLDLGFE